VIPNSGIVVPVVNIPENSQAFRDYMGGKNTNINKYLENGVLHHPESASIGELGNAIIAGHSSFYKSSEGRWKTALKYLPVVDAGEEIWIWKKYDKEYKLLRYIVTTSYETKPVDTSILAPSTDRLITLYTCVPIGTDRNRWVVQAKMIEE
jgi:sortase (surface protein transpeptidase)